jgi:hypothetical protein
MPNHIGDRGPVQRLLQRLGLIHPAQGEPRRSSSGAASRYGRFVSRRLDEDVDDLLERMAALESQASIEKR